jgi:hypothetical protein
MRYALGFSRASITVKVLCLLRVNYIFKYFKLFFPCFPGLPCLSCFPSRLSLALPSLALLAFPCFPCLSVLPRLPVLPSRLSLASLACLACLSPWRESKDLVRPYSSPGLCAVLLSGLPLLVTRYKKAGVLPPAFALILFAFSGL